MGLTTESPEVAERRSADRRGSQSLWRPWTPVDRPPLLLVEGDGCHVVDADGRRYIDAKACVLNASCGYGVDAIVDAVAAQLKTLMTSDATTSASLPALE